MDKLHVELRSENFPKGGEPLLPTRSLAEELLEIPPHAASAKLDPLGLRVEPLPRIQNTKNCAPNVRLSSVFVFSRGTSREAAKIAHAICDQRESASAIDITSASKGRARALYPVSTSHLDEDEPHSVRFFYPLTLGADASHKTLTGGLGRGTRSVLLTNQSSPV